MIELKIGGNTKRSKLTPQEVKVDWSKLPTASQDFVIRYGLKQYLADAIAGEKTDAGAKASVAERLAKLEKADFSRTHGAQVDTVETRAAKMAKKTVNDAIKAKNLQMTTEQIAKAISALLDGPKGKAMREEAAKQLANEAKLAEKADDEDVMRALGLFEDAEDADTGDEGDDTPGDEEDESEDEAEG